MTDLIPEISFKPLGLLSIGITWIGLLFLVLHWRGDKSMSLSLHAAQTKAGQIYYFVLFAVTLPMFFMFITRWYVPALTLPRIYVYLIVIGILGQVVAIVVPSVGGKKEKIHNFGAYLMAFTLTPLTALLLSSNASSAVKMLAVVGSLYMLGTLVLSIASGFIRPRFLYFQSAYIAVFHLIILASTYSTK